MKKIAVLLFSTSWVLFSLSGCCQPADRSQLIAHRGGSFVAPENTVAAVKQAWIENADAAEIDIYLTKDNRIMVLHDLTTKRTADVDLNIEQSTSDELRKLDVGSFKSTRYAGEKIPFIEEIFQAVPDGKELFIEIKCSDKILPFLKDAINASEQKNQFSIICFNLEIITKAKMMMPEIPAYWLHGTGKNEETGKWIPHDNKLIETAKSAGIDGIDVSWQGVTEEFTKAVQDSGLKLYVWTVDDAKLAKKLQSWGVTGLTTNKPAKLAKTLKACE